MESADSRLVLREAKLIKLFDPPFDKAPMNPGYIKGYLPGVRENGGQYTHGALWMIMAFAQMGDSEKAFELFSLINPIHHADSPNAAKAYRVEPYVVAADVYAAAPHIGRGGWTWYTGSAGWMIRLITESILGITLTADKLMLMPHIPPSWSSFKIKYRYHRNTHYDITVYNDGTGNHVKKIVIDGKEAAFDYLPLVDDKARHLVAVYIGSAN